MTLFWAGVIAATSFWALSTFLLCAYLRVQHWR